MGAGDASWSDAERSNPVRRSIRGVDRRGLRWRPKPGLLIRLWRRRCRDRGLQHAPNGVPRHQRAPGVGLWAPHSTRLVTRVEWKARQPTPRACRCTAARPKGARFVPRPPQRQTNRQYSTRACADATACAPMRPALRLRYGLRTCSPPTFRNGT